MTLEDPQLSVEVIDPQDNRFSAIISCKKVQQIQPTGAYNDGCWWIHPHGRNISQNSDNHTIIYDRETCEITLHRKDFTITIYYTFIIYYTC